MKTKKTILRGTFCAIFGGICWGFSGTMGQFLAARQGIPVIWLTTVRMLLAGVLLMVLLMVRHPEQVSAIWKNRRDSIQLLLFAALGLAPCQFTYLQCIAYSNSATGTALNYLGQMMILFYICLTTRRLPTKWELSALLLALAGVFFLATHGNIHTLILSPAALFWGILGAFMVLVYTALPRGILSRYGSLVVTGWGMLIGGILLLLLSRPWTMDITINGVVIFGIFVMGVVGTAMAFTLYLQGVTDIGPVKTSLLSCSEIVTAAILTFLWLKTPLVWQDFLGMAFIIGMVIFLSRQGTSEQKTDTIK